MNQETKSESKPEPVIGERSAEEIVYSFLWGPDCPDYERGILESAIRAAKEYASQFRPKSSTLQEEKTAFEAGQELGWCKIHKTYEQWKSEQE